MCFASFVLSLCRWAAKGLVASVRGQDARSAGCLRYPGTRPDAGGNPGVFPQLLRALPGLLHLTVFRLQCHSSWAVIVCWTGNLKPCFQLISSDLPSPWLPCLPSGNTVNRHMTAALRLNSFSREMEGSGDGGGTEWSERHVTAAGHLGGWVSPAHQVEVSSLLIHHSSPGSFDRFK